MRQLRVNERIRVNQIRVIGEDGAQLGVMAPSDALRLARVVDELVPERNHHHLHRRQPHRQRAGVVLDQHTEEPLEAA